MPFSNILCCVFFVSAGLSTYMDCVCVCVCTLCDCRLEPLLMTDDEFLALLSELAPGPFVTGCPETSQAWK